MNQQRFPSVKALMAVFQSEEVATQARRILEMSRSELLKTKEGKAASDRCPTEIIRMHALNHLDEGLHGIESSQIKSEYFDYLNTGETYTATIIYWRGKYRVQDVGTFIERNERLVKNA